MSPYKIIFLSFDESRLITIKVLDSNTNEILTYECSADSLTSDGNKVFLIKQENTPKMFEEKER